MSMPGLAAAAAQVTLYYDTMDAASFDQIKLKQPSLSRPFSQQLGDNRSGIACFAPSCRLSMRIVPLA